MQVWNQIIHKTNAELKKEENKCWIGYLTAMQYQNHPDLCEERIGPRQYYCGATKRGERERGVAPKEKKLLFWQKKH